MADARVLVVASGPLARAGLATILSDRPGLDIVGQVSGEEALNLDLDIFRPDVLLWDLGWEPEENLDLISEMAADPEEGGPVIVALVPTEEQLSSLWSAGIRGILLRDGDPERLQAAIIAAAAGLIATEPVFLESIIPSQSPEEPDLVEALTQRETEVLQLLAEGLANKAIAQRLEISEHTVKFHVNAIMGKLAVQSRTAAVVRATRLGLILI